MVLDLIVKSLTHFELIFVSEVRQWFLSFTCGWPGFPNLFIEETVL